MDKQEIASKLRSMAQYLKETRIPVGEKAVIEHILGGALMLEKMAEDIEKSEQK
jgi:hypothetical protein